MGKTFIKFLEPYEKELNKKIKKKGLTITVSGLSGAGKSLGARAIAEEFNLKYASAGEILRDEAKRRGISLEELCKIREPEIDYAMDIRTLKLAMGGNVVIDGRLSGWVAGKWADVKVFYDCSLEVRAKRVAKRDKIPVEEAERRLKERDKADHEKYKKLYGIDSFDKSIYDIIINNDKLTKEEVKKLSISLVKKHIRRIQGKDIPSCP